MKKKVPKKTQAVAEAKNKGVYCGKTPEKKSGEREAITGTFAKRDNRCQRKKNA